jgi:hypothetical protein
MNVDYEELTPRNIGVTSKGEIRFTPEVSVMVCEAAKRTPEAIDQMERDTYGKAWKDGAKHYNPQIQLFFRLVRDMHKRMEAAK